MKKSTKYNIALAVGIIITLISGVLFYTKNLYWYFIAPFGLWLIFDSLSYYRKRETILNLLFEKRYKDFLKLFTLLYIAGILIELCGDVFQLWNYKIGEQKASGTIKISDTHFYTLKTLGFFVYPAILMHFRELYSFIRSFFKQKITAVVCATLIGVLLWEVVNLLTYDWTYTVPFFDVEFYGINVFIIVTWVFLIVVPQWAYVYATKKEDSRVAKTVSNSVP